MGEQVDVRAGRLRPEEYAAQLRRPAPAARPQAGAGRRRSLLLLLRRALHRGLPDRHRHPALHPRASRPTTSEGAALDHPRGRTSWAACCARVCPTEVLCEGACVRKAQEGKPVRSACCSATPPTALLRARRAALRARRPDRQARRRRRRRARGPRLRPRPRHARPRRRRVRGAGQVRRPQRVRHRRLQGARRFRPGARSTSSCPSAASRSATACELGREVHLARPPPRLRRRLPRPAASAASTRSACPSERLEGVLDAVDYIAALRQTPDLAALPVGRDVVVIGGGNTAIDIAVAGQAAGRRDRHHRLPARPGSNERHRLRAGAGPGQRRADRHWARAGRG